jgi:hypothetical protein
MQLFTKQTDIDNYINIKVFISKADIYNSFVASANIGVPTHIVVSAKPIKINQYFGSQ